MTATEPTQSPGQIEQRAATELQPHPQGAEVPLLEEADFEALKADLATHGQQVPIQVTDVGVVLDGRARLRALRELGQQQILVTIHHPDDELAHMLRSALNRRHLTASRKAAIAAKLADVEQLKVDAAARRNANLRHNSTAAEGNSDTEQGRVRDRIAKLAGTSPRTAQDVLTVQHHDPELFERVLRGDLSAKTAASKVRRQLRDANLPAPPPLPEGPFQLILADPPWSFGSPDSDFAPEQHYPTMGTAEIKAIQVPSANDSILFLWACNSLLKDAFAVIDAWGFTYKNNLVWVKNGIGPGVWARQRHELLLIATKGSLSPPEPEDRVDSVIEAPRGRHSEKPEASYQAIERMYPQLTKLELFRRGAPSPGWHAWGNETQPDNEDETESPS